MAKWPVAMPAAKVAGTSETQPTGARHFPNQEVATRFAAVDRQIDHRIDAEPGAQITTVTPRQGAFAGPQPSRVPRDRRFLTGSCLF